MINIPKKVNAIFRRLLKRLHEPDKEWDLMI
jgi:hypothetical protein